MKSKTFFQLVIIALFVASCGGGSTNGTIFIDAGAPDTAAEVRPGDAEQLPDTEGKDIKDLEQVGTDWVGDVTSGFGNPCVDGSECASGLCIQTSGGSVCTQSCVEDCPAGWTCKGVAINGPDLEFVCVPRYWKICEACEKDEDCEAWGSVCHEFSYEGGHCAASCQAQEDCPSGYECTGGEGEGLCLPVSGSCTCGAGNLADAVECSVENSFGSCAGVRECLGVEGWGECSAQAPAQELCDGADNDCDGLVDEDFTDTDQDGQADCLDLDDDDDGDPDESDCQPLNPAVSTLAAELCDGLDNNCDGKPDETFFDKGLPCDGPDGDFCENGTWTCMADGSALECVNDLLGNSPEICDGLDNNCDGKADELFLLKGQPCDGPDLDLCPNGTWTCTPYGSDVECVNEFPTNVVELCDGIDNDCDGQIDEGFPQLGQACDGNDEDKCENGLWACDLQGGLACVETSGNQDELCDGQDNDCDGLVDEAFPDLNKACDGDDPDSCATGTWICDQDGTGLVCDGDLGDGTEEVCDGEDNDCDGEVDEGFVGLGLPCDGPDSDSCKNGHMACSNDGTALVCSEDLLLNKPELCDGLDNDCDGAVDEDFPDLGLACDGDDGDLCEGGEFGCALDGSGVICKNDNSGSGIELCDGIDNNCDGRVDEDFPTVGTACDGPDSDMCANGEIECKPDGTGIRCSAETLTSITEICDGLDNDCDGSTDEGYLGLGEPCDGPDGDLCMNGVKICNLTGTAVECGPETVQDIQEICDGLDNNCNGLTDEGYPLKGQACDGPDEDKCTGGTWVCAPDGVGLECSESGPVQVETCDGIDNDCDGVVDDGFPLLGTACDGDDPDQCKRGTFTCNSTGDGVECVNDLADGGEEICNGADDDCDGTVDEGFELLGLPCDGDDSDSCKRGTFTCNGTGDGVVCVNETEKNIQEICDGQDNDCDGSTDEGFSGLGTPCDGSDSDLCANGVKVCAGDGLSVVCGPESIQGIQEICGGGDEDCDGSVDEEGALSCTNYYPDSDGDGYGAQGQAARCLCAASGIYKVTNANDCCDSSANAKPGQVNYFTTSVCAGSFDYNCVSGEEKKLPTTIGSCGGLPFACSGNAGWLDAAPGCGGQGIWINSCVYDIFQNPLGCTAYVEFKTQSCR